MLKVSAQLSLDESLSLLSLSLLSLEELSESLESSSEELSDSEELSSLSRRSLDGFLGRSDLKQH